MIIIDDLSTDDTASKVCSLINALESNDLVRVGQVTFVKNEKKCGEVVNTLNVARSVADDEILCRLDGGDWLIDNDCLAILDTVYADKTVGCVWSRHRWGFSDKNISGPLRSADEDVYQSVDNWRTSHLKTWRKYLMNDIADANYRDENGDYITVACDRAIYLPILHRALVCEKKRVFVPYTFYHYSIVDHPHTYMSDRAMRQRKMAEYVHRRGYIL